MSEQEKARRCWDAKAEEWNQWVGMEGDRNRRWNSDPVLWRMLGEVDGRDVLDAGCGNGYLSLAMAQKGARVTAVDWSEAMVAQSQETFRKHGCQVRLLQRSCSELEGIPDESFDLIVSNYVLMDAPDLEGAAGEFARVLRRGGVAVCVFSHPCFGVVPERLDDGRVRYTWEQPYIERWSGEEEWGPFTTPFTFFHRPLRDYWRSFRDAGFAVDDLDEPMVPADALEPTPEELRRSRMTPFSMAMRLVRV